MHGIFKNGLEILKAEGFSEKKAKIKLLGFIFHGHFLIFVICSAFTDAD